MIFTVSSINICICFIECGHRMSKHVDGHNSDRWDNSELRYTIETQLQLLVKMTVKCCNDKILH